MAQKENGDFSFGAILGGGLGQISCCKICEYWRLKLFVLGGSEGMRSSCQGVAEQSNSCETKKIFAVLLQRLPDNSGPDPSSIAREKLDWCDRAPGFS